jgi:replicative DNA helicase
LRADHPLSMVIVDHLQRLQYRGPTRYERVSEGAEFIKQLARDLDVVVLCLSQLSRSNEADTHAPRLSDLRDSGRIEEESDAVDLP